LTYQPATQNRLRSRNCGPTGTSLMRIPTAGRPPRSSGRKGRRTSTGGRYRILPPLRSPWNCPGRPTSGHVPHHREWYERIRINGRHRRHTDQVVVTDTIGLGAIRRSPAAAAFGSLTMRFVAGHGPHRGIQQVATSLLYRYDRQPAIGPKRQET
jgi:hypothetical protein